MLSYHRSMFGHAILRKLAISLATYLRLDHTSCYTSLPLSVMKLSENLSSLGKGALHMGLASTEFTKQ